MKQLFFLISILCLSYCQPKSEVTKHVFYLHGRIIELQGVDAVSEQFGKYEYLSIIDSLKVTQANIHHNVRAADVDFQAFCEKTSSEIDALVNSGVEPSDITVIGASKGAVMAMCISNMNEHPINYVLLAANNDYIQRENQWNLHGRILGIYERSDVIAGKDYQHWINMSTNAITFKQMEINTQLGHGFLYKPIDEWMIPTKYWISNKYDLFD